MLFLKAARRTGAYLTAIKHIGNKSMAAQSLGGRRTARTGAANRHFNTNPRHTRLWAYIAKKTVMAAFWSAPNAPFPKHAILGWENQV